MQVTAMLTEVRIDHSQSTRRLTSIEKLPAVRISESLIHTDITTADQQPELQNIRVTNKNLNDPQNKFQNLISKS
jgi:hypothetical protein